MKPEKGTWDGWPDQPRYLLVVDGAIYRVHDVLTNRISGAYVQRGKARHAVSVANFEDLTRWLRRHRVAIIRATRRTP